VHIRQHRLTFFASADGLCDGYQGLLHLLELGDAALRRIGVEQQRRSDTGQLIEDGLVAEFDADDEVGLQSGNALQAGLLARAHIGHTFVQLDRDVDPFLVAGDVGDAGGLDTEGEEVFDVGPLQGHDAGGNALDLYRPHGVGDGA
jgi:hypothetical protein